jgi:hypothetical protein
VRWPLNGVVSDRSGSVFSSDLEATMAVEHAAGPVVGAGDIVLEGTEDSRGVNCSRRQASFDLG